MSHFVTLLSPEGARYPRLSTADSTDSAVALLSQEPLVRNECLAGEGTPPSPARPARARSFSPPTTPLDLRAHGSPQPEPRLLPSDPYTSPRGGDVVSHLVTLLSPEWARYPLPQHCSLSPTRDKARTLVHSSVSPPGYPASRSPYTGSELLLSLILRLYTPNPDSDASFHCSGHSDSSNGHRLERSSSRGPPEPLERLGAQHASILMK